MQLWLENLWRRLTGKRRKVRRRKYLTEEEMAALARTPNPPREPSLATLDGEEPHEESTARVARMKRSICVPLSSTISG